MVATIPAVVLMADDANVARPLPTTAWIVLDVELDLLPFLEGVKLARTEC